MPRPPRRQTETPPASVTRPKQARSEATLQRILEAAETLIAKKRFGEISIPEIALQAKSSVGGFYGRFKDKNALLRALEERFFRRLSDRVDRVVEPELWMDTDLQGLTRGLIHELISAADDERNLMCEILSRIDVMSPTESDLGQLLSPETIAVHLQEIRVRRQRWQRGPDVDLVSAAIAADDQDRPRSSAP